MPGPYHIMLIPQARYWEWVQAARDYVTHFGITMTPDRSAAGRFRGASHVVTVVDVPGAWPEDILSWFRQNFPAVTVDAIAASSPAALKETLNDRVERDDRFGQSGQGFWLSWPTDYPVITQAFHANPQYYRRFGLPGHEGLDIRALNNTPIYACADGEVYQIHGGGGNHAYGIHIRIRHHDGYKTVYAHLARALVEVGDAVKAGDRIGLADSTGNSSASHLHLTLKKEGATERGETEYPADIVDPTPYLRYPGTGEPPLPRPAGWEAGVCLVGVHGRADGPLVEADYAVLQTARVEAVKLIANAQPENVDRIRALVPNCFLLARLFADFQNGRKVPADDFAQWQINDMQRLYDKGVRHFEIHNEPNLTVEGLGANWRNGAGFSTWFLRVREILQPIFPEAKFGFPGCSPGEEIAGIRYPLWSFLEQSEEAILAADWLGVHCYWKDEAEMLSEEGGFGFVPFQRRWPDKLLFITEFSNPTPGVPMNTKGRQYVKYFREIRKRVGLGAAFSFVLSASSGMTHEVWRRESGELTGVPALIGAREF